jgi:hypothetical protein
MNLQTLVISLVSLMVLSIVVAVAVSERNKRQMELRQKLARLRARSDYIKEIALATEYLVDDANIPTQLLFQASMMAKQIEELAGSDPHAQATLRSNLELITRWETDGLNREMRIIANNNVEVDRYKKQLFEADRILQVSMQIGLLDKTNYQQLKNELAWSTLAIEANAHLKQGDVAAETSDTFTAQAHFRHARNCLEASHCKDPRCLEMIVDAKAKLDALDHIEHSS